MNSITDIRGHHVAENRAGTTAARPRTLLRCGAFAGPVFLTIAAAQVTSRDGFDLSRHPLSLLSLGDLGWIQITNFVLSGLLVVAAAIGIRRTMRPGRGSTWGPLLVGAHGAGLVAAGIFVADPSLGFPAGAVSGEPDGYSWHSILHGAAFGVGMLSVIAACFVFARRFASGQFTGWAAYCAATGVAVPVVLAAPWGGFSVRAAVVSILIFAWSSALSTRLLRADTAQHRPTDPAAHPTTRANT